MLRSGRMLVEVYRLKIDRAVIVLFSLESVRRPMPRGQARLVLGLLCIVSVAQASQVATPTFSPAQGTFTSAQSVSISDTTSAATIRYTTDGSTPSHTAGTVYSGAVAISSTTTLKAIAYKNGSTDSVIASGLYTITGTVANPSFSPAAGTYTSAQTVTLSTSTPGASIRYTTDNSTPTPTAGTLYSTAINIAATTTVKAVAYETGWNPSNVTSATYTITGTVANPSFSPAAGTYTSAQAVTLSTSTPGASIRYTTDNSTPTPTAGTLYSTAINIAATTTVKAVAYETGWNPSNVTSATYTITGTVANPSFSPAAGTYTSAQAVTISTTTAGASIRYTSDGSTPSATVGTVYSGPVTVSSSITLNAIAYKSGWTDSAVSPAPYVIGTQCAAIQTLPDWCSRTIGNTDPANTVAWGNGTFNISAGVGGYAGGFWDGTSIDAFYFVYQASPLSGDGALYGRMLSSDNDYYDAHGIMLRSGTGNQDAFVFFGFRNNRLEFTDRLTTGTASTLVQPITQGFTLPFFFKLIRAGNTVTAFTSSDGTTWTQYSNPVTLSGAVQPLYAGMALSGGSGGTTHLATATFDNVQVVPAASDFYLTAPASIPPTVTIHVDGTGGFAGTVSFNISGLPSGVSASLSSSTISGSGLEYISFVIPAGLAAGSYPFAVTATSGTIVHTVYPVLTVVTGATCCLSGWVATAINSPSSSNAVSWGNGAFNISAGVGGYAGGFWDGTSIDAFYFVYQASPLSGDGAIYGRMLSSDADYYDAHGIMLRSGTGYQDAFVFFGFRNNRLEFTDRLTAGTASTLVQPLTQGFTLPFFFKLGRAGSTVTAFTSSDGATWTQYSNPVTLAGPIQPLYAGMALSGGSGGTTHVATATFDNVQVVAAAASDFYLTAPASIPPTVTIHVDGTGGFAGTVSFNISGLPSGVSASLSSSTISGSGLEYISFVIPAGLAAGSYPFAVTATSGTIVHTVYPVLTVVTGATCCLSGWVATAINSPSSSNAVSWGNGAFNISAGVGGYAGGFWDGTSIDAFYFVYQASPLSGDGAIYGRMLSSDADYYDAHGIMLRSGTGYQDAFVFFGFRNNRLEFTDRLTAGTASTLVQPLTDGFTLPLYLKLVRAGNTVTALRSIDGATWTQYSSSVTLSGPIQPLYAGMALSGGSGGTTHVATATFDNVQVVRGSNPALTINTTALTTGVTGAAYSQTLSASGGVSPYTSWALTAGTLPGGLSLSSGGAISGTPTAAGTSVFTVELTDSAGNGAASQFTLVVVAALSIQTLSLPTGTAGVAYPAQVVAAAGGTPPYTWSIASGSLPSGLALSHSVQWTISGTPTTPGVSNFSLRVVDSGVQSQCLVETYSISIGSWSSASAVKEYIRAGSRVIAIETAGAANPTPGGTPAVCGP